MPMNNPPPGWYRDPTGFGEGRFWDGTAWTNSISRANETISAPIEPERAALPPVPGSELRPPAATPAVMVNAPNRSPIGAILGGIVAILLVVVIIVLVTGNDDSTDNETPPATNAPATAPATEAPAEGG